MYNCNYCFPTSCILYSFTAAVNSGLWLLVDTTPHYQEWSSSSPRTLTTLTLTSSHFTSSPLTKLLIASNTAARHWLYVCSLPPTPSSSSSSSSSSPSPSSSPSFPSSSSSSSSHPSLAHCSDLSPLAALLPPREQVVKYVVLGEEEVGNHTHLVVVQETLHGGARRRREGREKEGGTFIRMEECEEGGRQMELPLFSECGNLYGGSWFLFV